jgi:LysM repeat protein
MRRLLSLCLTFLLLSSAASAAPADRDDDGEKVHVVTPGQTLAKIAKRYRVSIDELREHNDLPSGRLKPGTRLVIPSDDAPRKTRDRDEDRKEQDKGKKAKGSAQGKHGQGNDDRDDEEDAPKKSQGKTRNTRKDADESDKTHPAVEAGHLRLLRGEKSWEGKVLLSKQGKIAPAASRAFARLAPESGHLPPQLIALVTRISDHFGGRPIELVQARRSRSGKQTSGGLNFEIQGVRSAQVLDYARSLDRAEAELDEDQGSVRLRLASDEAHGKGEGKKSKGEGKKKEKH